MTHDGGITMRSELMLCQSLLMHNTLLTDMKTLATGQRLMAERSARGPTILVKGVVIMRHWREELPTMNSGRSMNMSIGAGQAGQMVELSTGTATLRKALGPTDRGADCTGDDGTAVALLCVQSVIASVCQQ